MTSRHVAEWVVVPGVRHPSGQRGPCRGGRRVVGQLRMQRRRIGCANLVGEDEKSGRVGVSHRGERWCGSRLLVGETETREGIRRIVVVREGRI